MKIKMKYQASVLFIFLLPLLSYGMENQPPVVEAGADIVTTSLTFQLNGTVADDGLPNPPGQTTNEWTLLTSSPAVLTAAFEDPSSPISTVTLSGSGIYILELKANDGEFIEKDQVVIQVDIGVSPPPG